MPISQHEHRRAGALVRDVGSALVFKTAAGNRTSASTLPRNKCNGRRKTDEQQLLYEHKEIMPSSGI
jgi:hypothetical protein